jgi:hypothetical protein
MDMKKMASGVPWLDQPVMLHSSRADKCKLSAAQCAYRNSRWRYWYVLQDAVRCLGCCPCLLQLPSRPCLRSEYCIFRLCCHRSLRHIKSLSTICPRMGQAHSSLARYNISLAIYGLSWISIPCLTILVAIPGSYSAGPDRCCFLLWYVKFSPSNGPLPPLP